jgi:hypothetical protein
MILINIQYSWIAHATDFRYPALKFEPRTCTHSERPEGSFSTPRQMQMDDLICYMKLRKKIGLRAFIFFSLSRVRVVRGDLRWPTPRQAPFI